MIDIGSHSSVVFFKMSRFCDPYCIHNATSITLFGHFFIPIVHCLIVEHILAHDLDFFSSWLLPRVLQNPGRSLVGSDPYPGFPLVEIENTECSLVVAETRVRPENLFGHDAGVDP